MARAKKSEAAAEEAPTTTEPVERKDDIMEAAAGQNLIAEHYYGTAEKTIAVSSYVPASMLRPYNPDEIVQKTGDYRIYEEMKKDDQITVAMQLKKDLVVGAGWKIASDCADDVGEAEKDSATKIAKDIFNRLEEDMDVALDEQLEEFIDAEHSYGFALAEKIFKIRDDNTLTFKELKTRHPASWLIHTDEHGNIERYEQRGSKSSVNINPKSLIHSINSRAFQNPYGRSDLKAVYDAWLVKRHVIRFYSIFLEKNASPTPVGKYDQKTPKDKRRELLDILKKFQAKTAIVIPKEIEVDFLEAKSNGEAYIKGLNLFNMFIGRGLILPDLLGFSGSESQTGGSQALGREQINVFMQYIKRRRRKLERIVNRHIVQPMCTWNYGMMESYPKFELLPISEDDAEKYAKMFAEAMRGKMYKPTPEEINHFRALIKFPEGPVEFHEPVQALGLPGQPNPLEVNEDGDGKDPNAENADQAGKEAESDPNKGADKGSGKKPAGKGAQPAKANDKPAAGEKKSFSYDAPALDYGKKVDFARIKTQLDNSENKLKAQADPIIDMIFEDLIDQLQKKKVMNNPDRLESVKLKSLKQMQVLLKKSLREGFSESGLIARNELIKGNFAKPSLPSEQFLNMLEAETFDYIGRWEYIVTEGAKQAVRNAIKDGKPISSVIEMIDQDTREKADASLERYARTKFTEVMNRARINEFYVSGVVKAFQYSAILDDRTSDICAGLHGKVFAIGTEPIPPMHFNCRSVLVPITVFEEFTVDKEVAGEPIEKFIDENKGDGFSTR